MRPSFSGESAPRDQGIHVTVETEMSDSSTTQMVGIGIPTLRGLRSAVLSSAEPETAVNALREAGYAGGDAVLSAFEQWLAESGAGQGEVVTAGDLTLDEFGARITEFFRDAGWGVVTFSDDDAEGVAVVDIDDCWESGDGLASDTGCQITTGLLAAFFGRIADYPVAVLETECRDATGACCRFLLGNADVMNYKWEEMR
jgi:predicted hydrocarbon binding protein